MRGVCGRALKLPSVGEGCAMNELMITDRQPDSGKPTVRDERGAYGNVMQGLTAVCHEIGNDGYIGSR